MTTDLSVPQLATSAQEIVAAFGHRTYEIKSHAIDRLIERSDDWYRQYAVVSAQARVVDFLRQHPDVSGQFALTKFAPCLVGFAPKTTGVVVIETAVELGMAFEPGTHSYAH